MSVISTFYVYFKPGYKLGWDIAEWLERLTANAVVATVLGSVGSIPASSDTLKSEGRQMKQCWISFKNDEKSKKSPFNKCMKIICLYKVTKRNIILTKMSWARKKEGGEVSAQREQDVSCLENFNLGFTLKFRQEWNSWTGQSLPPPPSTLMIKIWKLRGQLSWAGQLDR